MHLEDNIEFAVNPETRCPVVLLLDTSGSMSGERIDQLNLGVTTFKQEVEQDPTASLRVEVAVITFDNSAQVVQDFVTINQFIPPVLQAIGRTSTGQGIELALDTIEKRKSVYKNNGVQYYRPWLFLITDGSPTDSWQQAAQRAKQAVADGKLSFFAVGVQGADMATLGQIASPGFRLLCWID
ncbi:vWA domain-containing protein [Scytonema sp. PRP1]|uniref:vWA domain-containing protein n=1 Tax=Scytonema sp. PRP1 TaxID=3120513 RepID=UPI00300D556B